MSYIDSSGNIHEGEDLQDLLNKIKTYLLQYYKPVAEASEAECHYSTREIHQQLLRLFPNAFILTEDLVAVWLSDGNFTFYDFGHMKFEWLMKKA